jgi:hypothetical protein
MSSQSGRIVWVPVQVPVSSIQGQLPTTYPFPQQALQTTGQNMMPVLQLASGNAAATARRARADAVPGTMAATKDTTYDTSVATDPTCETAFLGPLTCATPTVPQYPYARY